MKVSLPTLTIEYFNDKIVVTKKTPDAVIGDPIDDLMFLSSDCKDWKNGPDFFDKIEEHLHIAGWTHTFREDWNKKEKHNIFVKYVLKHIHYYDVDLLPTVYLSNILFEFFIDRIVRTTNHVDISTYFFDTALDYDKKIEIYEKVLKKYILKILSVE